MTGEVGWNYRLHFNRRIGGEGRNGAGHYTGFAKFSNLAARIGHHRTGTSGVPIMHYVAAAGIGFVVADAVRGTRDDERKLKERGHIEQLCSVCLGIHDGLTTIQLSDMMSGAVLVAA